MALSQFWRHSWIVLFLVAIGGAIAGHFADDTVKAVYQRLRPAPVSGPSSASTAYYNARRDAFALSKVKSAEIVMLGDSYIELGRWRELTGCKEIVNRGIGGDTTGGVLARLDSIIALKPKIVVIAVGTNDALRDGTPPETSAANIRQIAARLHASGAKVILSYVSPTSWTYRNGRANPSIAALNAEIEKLVASTPYIEAADIRKFISDDRGGLREDMTYDGLHPNGSNLSILRDAIVQKIGC